MKTGDVFEAVLSELEDLREAMLEYDAEAGRDAWDGLRITLDSKIGIIRALVKVAQSESGEVARSGSGNAS